jgi:hypothetical protein
VRGEHACRSIGSQPADRGQLNISSLRLTIVQGNILPDLRELSQRRNVL